MKTHHLFIAALCAVVPFIQGCSNEDDINPNSNPDGCSVIFSLGVAGNGTTVSRANPITHEDGLDGEREVNDCRILIYEAPINSDDPGKIVKVLKIDSKPTRSDGGTATPWYYYYPSENVLNTVPVGTIVTSDNFDGITVSVKETDLKRGQRYYALALVNFGTSLDATVKEGYSMSTFREQIYKGDLCDPAASEHTNTKWHNFRMTGMNEMSFIWEPDENNKIYLCPDGGRFLVQRLAARLDLSFGELYDNNKATQYDEGTANWDIQVIGNSVVSLRVYNNEEGTNYGKVLKDNDNNEYQFIVTDLQLVNGRNQDPSGMYFIERSGEHGVSDYKYLDNESWAIGTDATYASKTVKSVALPDLAPGTYFKTTYSLTPNSITDETYKTTGLWSNLYSSSPTGAYSILGYMTENTAPASAYRTTLKIVGWTNASTSSIFQAKSRAEAAGTWTKVEAYLPIRHSIPTIHHDSNPMEYSIVRNTIYRLRIKVFASAGKIYFRYYYYGNVNTSLPTSPYDAGSWEANVPEYNDPGTVTPND